MAKKIEIELVLESAGAEDSLAQVKQNIKAINDELKSGGGTRSVSELNAAMAQSKDRANDLRTEMESLGDTVGQNLGRVFQGVGQQALAGFSVATGALGVFGKESKAVEEAQKKASSAVALLTGLVQLQDGAEKLSAATKILYARASGVASAANVTFGSTLALATGGLTVIIPLLYAAYSIFTSYGDKTEENTKANEEYAKSLEKISKIYDAQNQLVSDATNYQITLSKLRGDSIEETSKIAISGMNEEIKLIDEETRKLNESYLAKGVSDEQNKIIGERLTLIGNNRIKLVREIDIEEKTAHKNAIDRDDAITKKKTDNAEKIRIKNVAEKNREIEEIKKLYDIESDLDLKLFKEREGREGERAKNIEIQIQMTKNSIKQAYEDQMELFSDMTDAEYESNKGKEMMTKDSIEMLEYKLRLYQLEDEQLKLQLESVGKQNDEQVATVENVGKLLTDEKEITANKRLQLQLRADELASEIKLLQSVQDKGRLSVENQDLLYSKLKERSSLMGDINAMDKESIDIDNKKTTEYEKQIQYLKEHAQEISNISQGLTGMASILQNLTSMQTESDLFAIDSKKRSETESFDLRISQARLLGQSTKQIEIEKLQSAQRLSIEEDKIKKKAFEDNKAIQIASAIIAGGQAVITAYSAGPIAGPILAGITAIAVGAQIAKMQSTEYKSTAISGVSLQTSINNLSGAPSGIPQTGGVGASSVIANANQTNTQFGTVVNTTGFRRANPTGGDGSTSPTSTGPIRVYVTEGDISEVQTRVAVIESRTKF